MSDAPLGMRPHTLPAHAEAIGLRHRIAAAGPAGYLVNVHDVYEVLALYDLWRRGELAETAEPWRYRLAPRLELAHATAMQTRRR